MRYYRSLHCSVLEFSFKFYHVEISESLYPINVSYQGTRIVLVTYDQEFTRIVRLFSI